jgi:hypothetical protein
MELDTPPHPYGKPSNRGNFPELDTNIYPKKYYKSKRLNLSCFFLNFFKDSIFLDASVITAQSRRKKGDGNIYGYGRSRYCCRCLTPLPTENATSIVTAIVPAPIFQM